MGYILGEKVRFYKLQFSILLVSFTYILLSTGLKMRFHSGLWKQLGCELGWTGMLSYLVNLFVYYFFQSVMSFYLGSWFYSTSFSNSNRYFFVVQFSKIKFWRQASMYTSSLIPLFRITHDPWKAMWCKSCFLNLETIQHFICQCQNCQWPTVDMFLVTKKNWKLLWKNFYTLSHFTRLNSTLVTCELRTVSQYFIIVVFWFKVSVYVHYASTLKFF